ncbi:unnamed protein product [Acanthosepion pharaonis]|uniref:Uncharacterized protein n=1 Tax=Acanthosepion pharaonis TaxID=158019 RepID=A0A812E222_ACAPH|nr:unnamed protein product [Sepia pharaonis]
MERTTNNFIVCIFLVFAVNSVWTFTSLKPLKHLPYKWLPGLNLSYCEYEGIKLMTGSNFIDIDKCISCSCITNLGLSCYGIGASAGVIQFDDCVAVSDNFLQFHRTITMKTVVVCVLLAFVVACATAMCIKGNMKRVPYKWSKGELLYCEYKEMKFKVGSKFTDVDACMRCSCDENGLDCCGIGYYAGVMSIEGCEIVPDHCKIAILNKNKTALCH